LQNKVIELFKAVYIFHENPTALLLIRHNIPKMPNILNVGFVNNGPPIMLGIGEPMGTSVCEKERERGHG
jgi:hypothetical protein